MQTTTKSTLIVGATALFAMFSAAHAAEPFGGGVKSLRSYLNENLNDFRSNGTGQYGGETTSVRSMVQGILKDVGGARRAKKK
jgi:hypothetical protein